MTARGARSAVDSAASRAAPMLVTAALALTGALDLLPLPVVSAPVRLLLVLAALVIGIGLTVALDRPAARPYWQMGLGSVLILMPIVALQASASRVPFVAVSRGSAGPLLWLTFATVLTLLGLWLFAAYQSDQSPENAALLFLPAALLVPAILGARGSLGEASVLAMLGEASLLAAAIIFIAVLGPARWRPVAGGAALGAQYLLLLALGRGPVTGQDAGAIVPVCAVVLLAVTALLTVLTPLGALVSRRFFQTVEDESGVPKPASIPPKGARRSDRS
jgi:hypothetical protein